MKTRTAKITFQKKDKAVVFMLPSYKIYSNAIIIFIGKSIDI